MRERPEHEPDRPSAARRLVGMGLAGLLLGLGLLGVPGGSALAIVGLALASRLLRAGRRWLLCATIFASTAGAVSACWLPEALR